MFIMVQVKSERILATVLVTWREQTRQYFSWTEGTLFGSVGTLDKVIGRSLYPLLPFLVFFMRENFRCRYPIYFDIEFLLKDVLIIESSLIILLKTLFMHVILALVLLKGFHHFFKLLIIGSIYYCRPKS